ncbi:ANR family transcriptional regulator [Serratia bockelmannii]|uniref:ANR family transcriptional regulator n=1 Tax=Serratia bockelmannii TaxID=2703793 RepID=UPI00313E574E
MTMAQESEGASGKSRIVLAPDKVTQGLAAVMFPDESPRARYRQLSTRAAQLERNGQYDGAMRFWMQAAGQALCTLDRHWCESRAQWCEHRLQRRG